jgi:hypothetical protein
MSDFFTDKNIGLSEHFGIINSIFTKMDLQPSCATPSLLFLSKYHAIEKVNLMKLIWMSVTG